MNTEWIESFMHIASTGSISAAADLQYLSQSTVSSRLASLEGELGCMLVDRSRGKRQMELTTEGEKFLPIARRMIELKNRALSGEEQPPFLHIAAIYSMNYSFLPELYQMLLDHTPPVSIRTYTNRSEDMYSLIEHGQCDFCFTTTLMNRKAVRAREIFRQKMVVIMKNSSPGEVLHIHPHDLDPEKEIINHSETQIIQYHDYWWKRCQRIHVDSTILLERLLAGSEEGRYWALVPVSTVSAITTPVQVYELTAPPLLRSCYLLESVHEKPGLQRKAFFEELDRFLSDDRILKNYGLNTEV